MTPTLLGFDAPLPRLVVAGVLAVAAVAAPSAQQPTFRAGVELVTTDVVARDQEGRFVPDLSRDDFEVWEDGVKQEIASLVLVHGGRTFTVQAAPAPPPAPSIEGIVLPPSRPAPATPGRIFFLFVDDLHLAVLDTPHVRALFKQIATTLIHEGDMFAMVSTGPSSVAIDLSYDRGLLQSAISRIKGNGLSVADIIEGPQGRFGPSEVRFRAHVAFSTAYRLMRELEGVENRRKAVILVSSGYDFDPFAAARQGRDQVFGRGYGLPIADEGYGNPFLGLVDGYPFADTDLALQLAELARAANRANATFYPIDPRGLAGVMDAGRQIDPREWATHLHKTQQTLRLLADATGGIAVVNQNDFDAALKRIDAETSDYYVLGYYPSNSDSSHRVRQIEVKVNRDDVTVRSREWYSLNPPATEVAPPAR